MMWRGPCAEELRREMRLETSESLDMRLPWTKEDLSMGFEGSYLVECGRFLITEHRFGLGSLLAYGVMHFTEVLCQSYPQWVSLDSSSLSC